MVLRCAIVVISFTFLLFRRLLAIIVVLVVFVVDDDDNNNLYCFIFLYGCTFISTKLVVPICKAISPTIGSVSTSMVRPI